MRKGEPIKIRETAPLPEFRGLTGVIRGFRPDGAVVVEFPTGLRRPFAKDHLGPP